MLSSWTEDKCIGNAILKHVSTYYNLADPCVLLTHLDGFFVIFQECTLYIIYSRSCSHVEAAAFLAMSCWL